MSFARALFVVPPLLVGIAGAVAAARRGWMRVEVAGESMTPALLPGDFLVLRRGAPAETNAFGQIVATRDPRAEGDGRLLLKRIVGLPGEALRVGGGVQVNGLVLLEPYAHGEPPAEQHRGINRLGSGEYFLLGDHRGASTDSRDFGPVTAARIEGTAALRYWPPRRAGRLQPPERRLLGIADRPASSPVPGGPAPVTWHDHEPESGKS